MQIGIFFGSFDPPHLGHLISARKLVASGQVDQVWFMPCFAHVWSKKLSPAKHRLKMLKALENKKIKASGFEIKAKKPVYTIDSLARLAKKHPQHQFVVVLGEKSLAELLKWKDHQQLKKKYRFLVVPHVAGISSSTIRERVKKGLSLQGLVPDEVAQYIDNHGLYQENY